MIPRSTRKIIHKAALDHKNLCQLIHIPEYQIRREIEIIATGICIGAKIKPGPREKKFVTLLSLRYAPTNKSNIITPN